MSGLLLRVGMAVRVDKKNTARQTVGLAWKIDFWRILGAWFLLLGLSLGAAPASAGNISNFDDGTGQGWKSDGTGQIIPVTSSQFHSPSFSGTGFGQGIGAARQTFPATVGAQVSASAWYKCPNPSTTVVIMAVTVAGNSVVPYTGVVVGSTNWVQVTTPTGVVPDSSGVSVILSTNQSGCFVDDVNVGGVQGNTPDVSLSL
ncbi:hypothetical protein PSQ20_19870 [Curvibacter sp. RS43]|uniref:hypothetical protein n=1 Tax=Curvibacter microcysteis TaxID=3026419 RepID=UPI00235EED6C|nr:hypothetical protein [Curvibacter sp. RS43]MDD0812615.1 hypothetical protein [Curvibacter sp. RS43]